MIMQLAERTTIREIKKHKQNIVYVVPTSEKNMQNSEKIHIGKNHNIQKKLAGVKVRKV